MTFGYIYKIEFPNGKVYIGLTTTSIEQRKEEHNRNAKRGIPYHLYNALRKHNMVDTFELRVIDTADTKEELCEKEIGYIQIYRSFEKEYGYNGTLGGDGTNGYVFTEEDRKKTSEGMKKYYETPGAKEKNSEAIKKYYETPGAKQRHSEILKNFHKENPEFGVKHSERLKKHYENPEARQKRSEILKKYYEETSGAREKNSERRKKYYEENPDARIKHGESVKKFYENPEARQKHSEALKKYFKTPGAKQYMLDKRGQNKPFDVFTTDGTFVKTFTYQMDAREYLKKELNITSTIRLGEVLKGRRKSSAGFVFKYK